MAEMVIQTLPPLALEGAAVHHRRAPQGEPRAMALAAMALRQLLEMDHQLSTQAEAAEQAMAEPLGQAEAVVAG
jgi:hypothetical protein